MNCSGRASCCPEGLGTLGTFEGSVARLSARKLRRISNEVTATNQKVGSSNLSGRAIFSCEIVWFTLRHAEKLGTRREYNGTSSAGFILLPTLLTM